MKKIYRHIPSRGEVYEITPNSGFVVVKYEGPNPDFAIRRDDDYAELSSGVLQCSCHPTIEIIPISYQQYKQQYDRVIEILRNRAA